MKKFTLAQQKELRRLNEQTRIANVQLQNFLGYLAEETGSKPNSEVLPDLSGFKEEGKNEKLHKRKTN